MKRLDRRRLGHAPADIRHEGRDASRRGLAAEDNPYPLGTPDFRAWEDGFTSETKKASPDRLAS